MLINSPRVCIWVSVLIWITSALSCTPIPSPPSAEPDPHSYAKPWEAKVTHLDLDLVVDFEEEIISGTAILSIERIDDADKLYLDTDGLNIEAVLIASNGQNETVATYTLGEEDSVLGQALIVDLKSNTRYVHVVYSTKPGAEALQFLSPELTSGDSPFLLTQSQSTFARTWVPIQDSPGIRFTYHATVKVPEGLMALMSAENPTQLSPAGIYEFNMMIPIPAYLLALAVGEVEFQAIGARTGVYAEPGLVEAAAYEFAEVEDMMKIAESLYGPYRWERYDIIVLPPSFPFGGMENPRLTFATPTILAGDRSLVSLVAHELAHSWSGNLVTNATWNDFWLNEGFTVYFELRIMEALKGRSYSEMLAHISLEDLNDEVAGMGSNNPDTRLKLELEGRHADDGMTSIAYDKGYYFLRLIEETVGRGAFDIFLKAYFEKNAFKSMTTDGFLTQLQEELLVHHPGASEAISIPEWVHTPGIPENLPQPGSERFDAVESAVSSWIAGVESSQLETANWSSHEWLHFIRVLPSSIGADKLAELDSAFQFTQSTNSEIQNKWYQRAIQAEYEYAYPAIRSFLLKVGRRKFLKPLYTEMMKTESGAARAHEIYQIARERYHPIAVNTIDEVLNWTP
ncbi:MAG: M1 family metallopeptidase [Bacteroidota bacterium]